MTRFRTTVVLTLFLLPLFAGSCGGNDSPRIHLKVALFPYIPDSLGDGQEALRTRIVTEFESQHPDIELELRPLDPQEDFYSIDQLSALLSEQGYDVIETDAVFLGKLAQLKLIDGWDSLPNVNDWHPAALAAAHVDGQAYGVPHWMCSYFLFSRDEREEGLSSLDELVDYYHGLASPVPLLAGNLNSSWDLSMMYLTGFSNEHHGAPMDTALDQPLVSDVVDNLRRFGELCDQSGGNPCSDGTYKNNSLAAQRFGRREVYSLFGFFETLHDVRVQNPSDESIAVTAIPFGEEKRPGLFVDVLVRNAACQDRCAAAAGMFADYLTSLDTYAWIELSQDNSTAAIPRYIVPARDQAYTAPGVATDPFFAMVRQQVANGVAYPNRNDLPDWEETVAPELKAQVLDAP